MRAWKWLVVAAMVVAMGGWVGCGSDSDSESSGGFSGQWTGKVCGRDLVMNLRQSGLTLTGDYTLSGVGENPDFFEQIVSGAVSQTRAPATAVLEGRGGRRFDIQFTSDYSFRGTFINLGAVCEATGQR